MNLIVNEVKKPWVTPLYPSNIVVGDGVRLASGAIALITKGHLLLLLTAPDGETVSPRMAERRGILADARTLRGPGHIVEVLGPIDTIIFQKRV